MELDLVVDRPALRRRIRRRSDRRSAHPRRWLALLVALRRRLRRPGLAALPAFGARAPVRLAAAALAGPLRQPRRGAHGALDCRGE
eukprot:5172945-Lingulodinium_polyedra.AAC.1